MSKTLLVEFRGRGFWAFDVISDVLLKHLVDVALPLAGALPWLPETVQKWRVNAITSDFGFFIDDSWTDEQVKVFCELLDSACCLLQQRDEIPAAEIEGWQILDDHRICARGIPVVPTNPVVQLGRAIIALVEGTLPHPPVGYWWLYTMEEATQIIRMHSRFTIAILEDNRAREQAMKTAVDTALPDAVCFFFDSAHAMIEWLRDWLGFSAASPPAMISLDHDLDFLPGPDGQRVDPGDGRDVVKFLAMRKPFCPVIVHTSNGLGAASMVCNLEEAGWKVTRVQPENDVGWVKLHWAVCAVRLVYEWEKLHSKVSP